MQARRACVCSPLRATKTMAVSSSSATMNKKNSEMTASRYSSRSHPGGGLTVCHLGRLSKKTLRMVVRHSFPGISGINMLQALVWLRLRPDPPHASRRHGAAHLEQDGQQDDPHEVEQPRRGREDDIIVGDAPPPATKLQARHGSALRALLRQARWRQKGTAPFTLGACSASWLRLATSFAVPKTIESKQPGLQFASSHSAAGTSNN